MRADHGVRFLEVTKNGPGPPRDETVQPEGMKATLSVRRGFEQ